VKLTDSDSTARFTGPTNPSRPPRLERSGRWAFQPTTNHNQPTINRDLLL